MEVSNCSDTDIIKFENEHLMQQNRELRKKLFLLQEKIEQENICDQTCPKETQQPCATSKHKEEEPKQYKDTCKMPTDDSRHTEGSKCLPDPCRQYTDKGDKKNECDIHFPQNSHQLQFMQRIVGEIAFQLDRRIISFIFPGYGRLYGITVDNIPQKINEVFIDPATGKVDEQKKTETTQRYNELMCILKQQGYDPAVHPAFSENIVNVYGIIKEQLPIDSPEMRRIYDPANLKKIASSAVPPSALNNVLILLNCLSKLSKDDGKPIFLL